jgi:dipeptidyl-peptidase 4
MFYLSGLPMKRLFLLTITIPFLLLGQNKGRLLTLDDIITSSKFKGKSLSGIRWLDQGNKFSFQQYDTTTKSENISVYNIKDGSRTLLVDVSTLKLHPGDPLFKYSSYQWSPQGNKILFVSSPPEKQYLSRLTPGGNYFLCNMHDKSFQRLTNVHEPQYNHKFSPDGTTLGFVRGNNIIVIDLASGIETQLTNDGAEHIINGKFDWVYEEEFGISDGWMWSPDGKSIAFWWLDENPIPEFKIVDFMTSHCDVITMRYPKAGDPNSLVRIGVISLKNKTTTWMDLGQNDDMYIPRIHWAPDGSALFIQRLNRQQNKLDILSGDIKTGKTKTILTEEEKTWIEEGYDIRFLPLKKQMLRISEQDGFAHIYRYDLDGKLVNQITKGEWDVSALTGVDETQGLVYFTAEASTLLEKQLYCIKLDGRSMRQITENNFTHSINIAPNAKYFIDNYSNSTTPTKISFSDVDGKLKRVIEENTIPALQEYALSKKEFFTFKTSDGVELNGSMIRPVDFDPKKKYPVLFDVYAGPGSQTVTNSWGGQGHLWYQMLAQKGYIIVSVDGRGTGGRGKAFKSIVYKQLGKWEVNDQVEGAKYLATLPYIDASRIGIWGWSYGGYMAVLTILQGADFFKTALAVAPVSDWTLYDDIYTERYMGLPKDNPDGYKESSTLTYADKLKGNLLIIHGTTDDNVHWQNSVQLIDALEKAGKHFHTMFYPNKNHGIRGGNTRYHLYETMTSFILENL